MEVLNEYIEKLRQLRFDVPNEITRDNVNKVYANTNSTLLGMVLRSEEHFEKTILIMDYLLSLGATLYPIDVVFSKPDVLCYLLDKGYDPNTELYSSTILHYSIRAFRIKTPIILIDYGALLEKKRPTFYTIDINKYVDYTTLSDSRVATSRKSLCALLWCSRNGLFPALRGIILELARSAWAQKGGEGCGPRGHGWVDEKK